MVSVSNFAQVLFFFTFFLAGKAPPIVRSGCLKKKIDARVQSRHIVGQVLYLTVPVPGTVIKKVTAF